MTASVPRTPGQAGTTLPLEPLTDIDLTGSKDGKNQVCGVDLNPSVPKEIRELLKPKVQLSAHPLFKGRTDPSKGDQKKADSAEKKGDGFLTEAQGFLLQAGKLTQEGKAEQAKSLQEQGAKKLGKAFEEYQKAFSLTRNPKDKELIQKLAFVANKVGSTALSTELYRILLSDQPCDFNTREFRMEANQTMLMVLKLAQAQGQIPASRQKEAAQKGVQSNMELELDQGLMVNRVTQFLTTKIGKTLAGYSEMDAKKQAEVLKQVLPDVLYLVKLKDQTPDTQLYRDTFATSPEVEAKKTLTTILSFTGKSSDPEIQKYHRVLNLMYHLNFGNQAYAFNLIETIVDEGLKELGDGDAAKGQKKIDAMLSKAESAKTKEEHEAAMKDLLALPPAFLEVYEQHKHIEDMQKIHKEGLLAVGQGDAGEGRKKVEAFLKDVEAVENEMKGIALKAQKLNKEGKEDEAKKLIATFNEQKEKGENLTKEFAKGFPSEKEFASFIEAYQAITGMEEMQKKEKVTRAMAFLDKYSEGLFDADLKGRTEDDSWGNAASVLGSWLFYYGPRDLITGKTEFDDMVDTHQTDLDIFMAMKKQLRKNEASTLSEAADQVKRDGSEEVQERLQELMDGETGFNFKLLLEYCSSPDSDPIKAKALLAEAEKMKEKDVHLVRAAWALEALVAETCSDPEVVKLAAEQRGHQAKAA